MKEDEDVEPEEKKQAAADVFHQYSKFTLASIGNRVRPCDLRMHLMKEISGIPSSLKRVPPLPVATSPDAMGESSSSGTIRLDKADTYLVLVPFCVLWLASSHKLEYSEARKILIAVYSSHFPMDFEEAVQDDSQNSHGNSKDTKCLEATALGSLQWWSEPQLRKLLV
ncbi:hypothetical protein V2J09_021552 [Rumex salicifolius]